MRISASTCSYEKASRCEGYCYTCEEAFEKLHEAGFRVVDVNLSSYSEKGQPMTRDDWADWCRRMKAKADELGLCIGQAHAHFYQLREDGSEDPWDRELLERSIRGAAIMGVKWMVFHPFNLKVNGWYNGEAAKKRNLELFREYAEIARPLGVGIAIENMLESAGRSRRYCSGPEELIDLVDTLNDPVFGICWDFGHANVNGIDQPAALRTVGKRLKALHVDDNYGVNDDHMLPYFGTIRWEPIMQTLHDIDYEGDFTYEVHRFHYGLPHELQPLTLRYTYQVAEHLVSLAK